MKLFSAVRLPGNWWVCFVALLLVATPALTMAKGQYPNDPSETPAHFKRVTSGFGYERHVVMIPMRDGVKRHTTNDG